MAKETKSFTCHPNDESDIIEMWQTFGWELFSTQEVRDSESHLEQGWGDSIKSVTTTTHYIKLTFQRDPNTVPHYQELKALEDQFYSVPNPGPRPTGPSITAIIIGVLLCTIPGIVMIIMRVNAAKQIPQWERAHAIYLQQRQEIYAQAQRISNS